MHYRSEKLGQKRGRGYRILTPNESVLTFWAHNVCAKFHHNQIKLPTVGAMTDRQTDASDFIICPMLCYSSGTDNNKSNTITYSVRQKKVSPKVICHFLSNHLEFLREILHVYYLFIYT